MSYDFRVLRIKDGDTFIAVPNLDHRDIGINLDALDITFRLFGVNAPERRKAGGAAATAYLTAWLARPVPMRLEAYGKEKYGRILCEVIDRDGARLTEDMLAAGHATVLTYRVSMALSIEEQTPVWIAQRGKGKES